MKKSLLKLVGLVSVSALVLSACTSNADSPGLEYMPDMYRSPAVEAYVDYGEVRGRIDESKKTVLRAMTPPLNTIPYNRDSNEVKMMLSFQYPAHKSWSTSHGLDPRTLSDTNYYEQWSNKEKYQNPIKIDTIKDVEAFLSKGKELFTAMCQHCHGEKGDGNGPMVVSKAFEIGVPNYTGLVEKSDYQLFYSIYYGKGMMGSHKSLLSKKEIWTLIHYIHRLQSPDYGKKKVPAAEEN